MGLSALIRERRPVVLAGRRFIVRAPTVGTVQLLVSLFPDTLQAVTAAWRAARAGGVAVAPEAFVPLFVGRAGALARVLGTCVETTVPPERWPLSELATAALSLCDPLRIARALAPDEGADVSDPLRASESVCRLARSYRCAPHAVMDWPYEAFLEVTEVRQHEAQDDVLAQRGFSQEFIAACRAKAAGVLN